MKKRKQAVTLMELMVSLAIIALISTTIYQIITGTLSQFGKNYGKLSNMRTASLIFERIKMDIRSSLPYSTKYGEKELCELGGESGAIISFFANLDKNGSASPESYAKVTYEYTPPSGSNSGEGIIRRTQVQVDETLEPIDSPLTKQLNNSSVTGFEIEKKDTGFATCLRVWLTVQSDEGSISKLQSEQNKFQLSTTLYPKFFKEHVTMEESSWKH